MRLIRLLLAKRYFPQPIRFHSRCSILLHSNQVTMATQKPPFQRLPTDVVPVNYTLILEPNLTEFTFKGNVVIDTKLTNPVNSVTVNSCEIEIDTCSFQVNVPGSSLQTGTIDYQKENETVKFTFQEALPGDGKLSLEFRGILNDQMKGFYR